MRLTTKLTVGFVLAALPVIVVSSGLRVRNEIAAGESDWQTDDVMLGRALAGATDVIWRAAGEREARSLLGAADVRQRRVDVRWTWLDAPAGSPDSPVVAPAQLASLAVGDPVTVHVTGAGDSDEAFLTYVAATAPNGHRGAIEIRRSRAEEEGFVHHAIRHAVVASAAIAALCGCVALALGALLVGRPVERLIVQMRRIGAGDLSARVRMPQTDELGQLGAEIDVMCDRLADARACTEAATSARLAAIEQMRHADRLATVGKLAAGVAHELGTPLNVISGHAQLITSDDSAGAAAHENAMIVVAQTQRVASIIRQLLDFARRGTPRRTRADLGPVVRDALALLAQLAATRRVAIELELAPELICEVDCGQLQQAVTNLVVNALQASSPRSRIDVTVARRLARPPGAPTESEHLAIEVADHGVGIAADALPRIFEPFFTTKDVGEGTGLGLSVAYGIVVDHHGWIEATSEVAKGSRFTIFLPSKGAIHDGSTARTDERT
jgi:two-component system, NtrC family, sensor kinase